MKERKDSLILPSVGKRLKVVEIFSEYINPKLHFLAEVVY